MWCKRDDLETAMLLINWQFKPHCHRDLVQSLNVYRGINTSNYHIVFVFIHDFCETIWFLHCSMENIHVNIILFGRLASVAYSDSNLLIFLQNYMSRLLKFCLIFYFVSGGKSVKRRKSTIFFFLVLTGFSINRTAKCLWFLLAMIH